MNAALPPKVCSSGSLADTESGSEQLPADAVRGGRTPCLEGNWDQAFPAMAANGLVYDTSKVALGVQWPTVQNGLYEFPMPEVRVPGLGKQVVMMDFNLWYSLNGAKEEPARAPEFTQIVFDTYKSVHQAALNGNRAPIVVGNHFNEWNGSAFSNAMARRDSIPRVVFGKCVPDGGRVVMPVALEVHHAVVQGRDAARFYERLQRAFEEV